MPPEFEPKMHEVDGSATSRLIGVLVADDHPVVRSGIKDELAKHADLVLVGEAVNGDQAYELARSLKPDVLLLDINMPGLQPVRVVRELAKLDSGPQILVLSAYGDVEYVFEMLKAGVDGYLLKDEEPGRIAEGIRAVAAGQTWLSAAVAESIVEGTLREGKPRQLSQREEEVLSLMAKGLGNEAIAEQLSISEGTVKNHVSNLYSKLGVGSRAEAVAWAWEHRKVKD